MKLLIVSATHEEISLSIPTLEKLNIPYIITGVGMTATAYSLGKELGKYQADLALNVGIAGSFDRSIPLGQIVQVQSDHFYELGAEDGKKFISIEDLGFGHSKYSRTFDNYDIHLPSYDGITVNRVHGDDESIQMVKKSYPNVQIESMEGAAFFYACQQENMPCTQIRCISNYVERRNRNNWNIPLAIKNLNDWLQQTIINHSLN